GGGGLVMHLPHAELGTGLTANHWLYYLTWTVAGILLLAAFLILSGRSGRAFRAIRDSEVAAVSSGVNLAAWKTLAFGISAFYAGVAGSLLAIASAFVNPDTFPLSLSILLLVGVVVGGLGSLGGVVLGALRRGGEPRRTRGDERRLDWRDQDVDHARRHVPAERPCVELRADPRRHEGLLQLRERPPRRRPQARRRRPPDHLEVLRRRVQPGEHRAADAEARRAGQGVRARRRPRHRAAAGGARLPQPAEGPPGVRFDRCDHVGPRVRPVPVVDRLAARLPGRGRALRQVHRRESEEREDRRHLPERRLRP